METKENSFPAHGHVEIIKSDFSGLNAKLNDVQFEPVFISGYVSPHLDLGRVVAVIKSKYPQAKILMCSTSGELCSGGGQLYCDTPRDVG